MVRRERKARRRDGFTVIEVMIAMIVLSVGLLGLLGAGAMTVRAIGESDRTVAAAYYASERLERLEALGCDQVSGGHEIRDGIYAFEWSVTGTAASQTRTITLKATYPLSGGRTGNDTFEKALTCVR